MSTHCLPVAAPELCAAWKIAEVAQRKSESEEESECYEIDCTVSKCHTQGSSVNVRATPSSARTLIDCEAVSMKVNEFILSLGMKIQT